MTPDVVAVLVVPSKYGLELVREGVCGARPPLATQLMEPDSEGRLALVNRWEAGGDRYHPSVPRALVIFWDGEVVPEGVRRLLWIHDRAADLWPSTAEDCAELARLYLPRVLPPDPRPSGDAARVVRLARVDGRLVELEPAEVGT